MITALENYLYINYTHVPTPVHLQNKISELFKDEILKSGIIINQKPEQYEIEKIIPPQSVESIEKAEEEIPFEKEEPKEVIELTEESEVKVPPEPLDIPEEEPLGVTEFEDSEQEISKPVEIDPGATIIHPEDPDSQPESYSDMEELIITDSRLEEKRKTRPLFKILLLVTLIVFSVYYFFIRENGLFAPSGDVIRDSDRIEDVSPDKKITPPIVEDREKDGSVTTEESGDAQIGQAYGAMTGDPGQVVDDSKKREEEENKRIEDEKKKLLEDQQIKEKKRLQRIEAEKRKKKAAEEKRKRDEEEQRIKAEEEEQKKLEKEKNRKAKEEKDKKALELKKKQEEEERNRIKPGQ
ncbi:MAG: hypothetical protein KAR14_04360, partial [Candidatus Aminicenantes bacterium]|nr:hypothetical protein [Candidatus Aminicenantes bacterium]